MNEEDLLILQKAQTTLHNQLKAPPHSPLPFPHDLHHATASLHSHLPGIGTGLQTTTTHLLSDILPGLNASSLSPLYYGFVTGGITPAARIADNIVTLADQNVQVHLPDESIATVVEDRALCMLLELLKFEPKLWPARSFTTGATASNVLGLACARDWVLGERLRRKGEESVLGEGMLELCGRAGVSRFRVLSTMAHSSLGKAASVVGLGSKAVVDVSRGGKSLELDMEVLEECLREPGTACIVVISCGEVNTGGFATKSAEDMQRIRKLCDKYGAWIHVDGAFGIFARALPSSNPSYTTLHASTSSLDLADSITGDGHKLLNVPYDSGFFLCRHRDTPTRVFQNTNAAYLNTTTTTSGADDDGIMSPLNVRLENSARFRGLPVYATLVAYGRDGYAAMVERMVLLARKIAAFIQDECEHLELLPRGVVVEQDIFICVLFRARDAREDATLVAKIKKSGKVYASGTVWEGRAAARFAIGKWDVDVERDFGVVRGVLEGLR